MIGEARGCVISLLPSESSDHPSSDRGEILRNAIMFERLRSEQVLQPRGLQLCAPPLVALIWLSIIDVGVLLNCC